MRPHKPLSSSVGSKFLIAFTGLSLLLFLVAHLGGNLLFLLGPDAFNQYSHKLISNPLIYVAEGGLLAVFLVHVLKTTSRFAFNLAARPDRDAVRAWARTKNPKSRKSLSSTTMILSGTLTLLFVITHLVTFKFGRYYETSNGLRDLYRLELEVFQRPAYVAFYLVCMSVILFHLWHGVSSAAQSFGVNSPPWTPRIVTLGRVLSVLIAGGFFIIPLYAFFLAVRIR